MAPCREHFAVRRGQGGNDVEPDPLLQPVEPDECYTVRRLAVDDDDRPDISIEVIWASGGTNKLEAYRKLGVREVWFYERESLRFFALRGAPEDAPQNAPQDAVEDARYAEIPCSELLPELPTKLLLSCMTEPSQPAALSALRRVLE